MNASNPKGGVRSALKPGGGHTVTGTTGARNTGLRGLAAGAVLLASRPGPVLLASRPGAVLLACRTVVILLA